MTDRNTERTRQTLEALAMVDYWRNEAEQQRTRAEAAEQDAREERMRADDLLLVVKHCHASSTHAAVMRGLNPAVGAVLDNAGKLAAIRAHLKDVDMKHESMLFDCMERVSHATTRLLLAAAREALEP